VPSFPVRGLSSDPALFLSALKRSLDSNAVLNPGKLGLGPYI